jgi:hypothetical protein
VCSTVVRERVQGALEVCGTFRNSGEAIVVYNSDMNYVIDYYLLCSKVNMWCCCGRRGWRIHGHTRFGAVAENDKEQVVSVGSMVTRADGPSVTWLRWLCWSIESTKSNGKLMHGVSVEVTTLHDNTTQPIFSNSH